MFRIAIMMSSLTTLRATSKLVVFCQKIYCQLSIWCYSEFIIEDTIYIRYVDIRKNGNYEKRRGTRKTTILAILIAVIGFRIGLVLNATLKITANTTLKGTNWSIPFQNVGSAEIVRATKKASLTQIEESKTEFTINVEFRLASPVANNIWYYRLWKRVSDSRCQTCSWWNKTI